MSVSRLEVSCDVPDCGMTVTHGPVRPPLSVGAFPEVVGLLLVAHGWTVDEEGRDLCALHSERQTADRDRSHQRAMRRRDVGATTTPAQA